MRTVSTFIVAVILLALVIIPVQYQRQEMEEPHPKVTSIGSQVPRINYVEQVRDVRRNVEKSANIKTIHHNSRDRSHYVEHEVVVRFSPRPDEKTIQNMLKECNGVIKRDSRGSMIIKSKTKSTRELMKYFAEHPASIYAEPNYLLLPNRRPNDEYYQEYQWNLPMIGMEQGWEITRGSNKVIVAVVDTGVDLKHPDFAGKLVTGYNVLEDNDNPQDDNGHGTHVAGVIAATTNNRSGIAGMSWHSKIMPIKAIGADGAGSAFDIAQGIIWATDNGARVINLSVGNYTSSAALKEACTYAYERNVALIAATGNDATDQPGYPAAYPEVMGVSAVDHNGDRADFSNYGDYVDVVAPGVDIPSTYVYNDYAALSGTSMACPHVAGLASLIISLQPTISNDKVYSIIRKTADDLGDTGKDALYGHGLINVNQAVQAAQTKRQDRGAGEPAENGQPNFFFGLFDKLFAR